MSTLVFHLALAFTVIVVLRSAQKYSLAKYLLALTLVIGFVAGSAGFVIAQVAGEGFFGVLRLWAWAIFFHCPLLLVWIAQTRGRDHRWLRVGSRGIAIGLLGIAIYAFRIEPHWLEVSRVTIESAKITKPIKIVLVADVQSERVGDYERRVLERVLAEKPDAILFAGDYIQGPGSEIRERWDEFSNLLRQVEMVAPLGVFAVRGNCEPRGWPRAFEGTDVHVFAKNGTITTGELTITGLTLGQSFSSLQHVPEAEGFHIVLGHAPDYAMGTIEADLLLAGHCHGGQVRVPFFGPPVTLSNVPRSWAAGVTEIRPGVNLIVSRGIGLEGGPAPRFRFLSRPEIVVIELVPSGPFP